DDEVQRGRAGRREFVPWLGAGWADVVRGPPQHVQSMRIDLAFGMGACGICTEAAGRRLVEDRFGNDGACRITRAKEENIITHARVLRGGQQLLMVAARGPQISGLPPQQSLVRNCSSSPIRSKSAA